MGDYIVKKVGPIGEFDKKYGQRYWGSVEGADMEISFNLMNPRDIEPGMKLEFDERVIKETKGSPDKPPREYMQLRKVRIQGASPQPTAPTNRIEEIYQLTLDNNKMLKQLIGEEDKVAEVDKDEEIDLNSIPF